MTYRLSRCAELTSGYIDKHFDWHGTIDGMVGLGPSAAVAAVSRWRDRETGWFRDHHVSLWEALQKHDVVDPRLSQSDPTRDWSSLAGGASYVRYGWSMGQAERCAERQRRPAANMPLTDGDVRASVWLDADQAQFLTKVEVGPRGYRFIVDCVRGCVPRTRYVQDISDAPISLFRLWDGDDLVFSVWSGGAAYRIRVWKIRTGGVEQILELSSRGRPDFLSAGDGAPMVRIYEADGGTQPRNTVTWTYRDGVFTRGVDDR